MPLAVDPHDCHIDDIRLKKWTFLRFLVLGSISFYRAWQIKENGKKQPHSAPFREHPKLTNMMNKNSDSGGALGLAQAIFYAGTIFIQSEGVGFAIYFSVSAVMDNYTIFFINSVDYCEYVMAVALYSMAVITFLPNCVVAIYLQGSWYDNGKWLGTKSMFIFVMVVVTMVSFIIRLELVFDWGWDTFVHDSLEAIGIKVPIAVLLPPTVDAIQALLLIASGLKTKETSARELQELDYREVADDST